MAQDVAFSPFSLKSYRLRNRLGVAPMTRMSSPGDSIPRKDVLEFLARRATNGAAIVFTEGIVTDYESAQGYPRQARLLDSAPASTSPARTYDALVWPRTRTRCGTCLLSLHVLQEGRQAD